MTTSTAAIELSLNGKHVGTNASDLQAFLLAQGYELKNAFACAVNSTFVPRSQWAGRALEAGDRIDVITPIAGG